MKTTANRAKDPILRQFEGRCSQCYMRIEKCICDLIPNINISTYLTVVMHHRESYKTTNTARLACMALTNSEIILRGLKHQLLSEEQLIKKDHSPILLTLDDSSHELNSEFLSTMKRPIQLIVPDGNWRQARKMGYREAALKQIPWVRLPPGPKSCYKLRHEHLEDGLSTLEAIARALTIIESPDVESQLMSFFIPMVERTIETRPKHYK